MALQVPSITQSKEVFGMQAWFQRIVRAINRNTPAGILADYAGPTAPSGWLQCDGSAVSRTTYPALFDAIGTTWGAGDGSTTFNLPDFTRRVTVGSGGSGTAILGNAVGNTGGEETHVLAEAELASHLHAKGTLTAAESPALTTGTAGGSVNSADGIGGTTAVTITISGSTATAGSDEAHNNMQPSAVVLKIIKV